MPVKTKTRRSHHVSHKREKRTKHFLKVYAPYIPLLLIVGCGLFVAGNKEIDHPSGTVKSYATDMSDEGLLSATNKVRGEEGLPPLTLNPLLDDAAQEKAIDMGTRDYWSHVTPEGLSPWRFIDEQDYNYSKAAENLAYGFDTSKSTVNGWMNSQGHRDNLLDPDLTEVGFGLYNSPDFQNNGPETIVVAMYAKPASMSPLISENSSSNQVSAQEVKNVSFIESITAGRAPWIEFAIGLLIGGIIMYLTIKHMRSIRKALKKSEKFALHHPLLDITLIALAILAAIVTQSVGTIH